MQLNSDPTSLAVFKFVCTSIAVVIIAAVIGVIHGPISITTAFVLGFLGSTALRVLFEKQMEYSYWWIKIFIELNIKKQDDLSKK